MKKLTLIALMLILGLSAMLLAQDNWHVDLVNEYPFHWVTSIIDYTISGNYAYLLGSNCGLSVLDISNPSNPIKVGYLVFEEYICQVEIHENYLYVSNYYNTVFIVDISNPSNPYVVNSLHFEYEAISIKLKDGFLYVLQGNYWYPELMVHNLIDPIHPELVGSVDLYGHITILDVSDGIVFLNKIDYGLILVDVQNPMQPEIINNLNLNESVKDVAIRDDLVCLVDPDSLYMIDISELDEPQILGSIELNCKSISILNFRLYVCRYDGIAVIDITDPCTPEAISTFEMDYNCHEMTILDGYGYLRSYGDGFGIVNLHDGNNITWVGGYDEEGELKCFDTYGDYVYCADEILGLVTLRIDDINEIELVNTNSEYANGIMIEAEQDKLFLVTKMTDSPWDYDIHIFDISSPSCPVYMNSINTLHYFKGLDACGDYLYMAGCFNDYYSGELVIYDVSAPDLPECVGTYMGGNYGNSVDVIDDLAYITEYNGSIQIVNVSNPAQPEPVGHSSLGYSYCDLALTGGYAYSIAYTIDEWGDWFYSTHVVDVNDPYHPAFIRAYNIPAITISASENFFCAANNTMWVMKTLDPANPYLSGSYELLNECIDINCYNHYVLLMDEKSLLLFDVETALGIDESEVVEAPRPQLSNYPNPFNPETTIRFSIPNRTHTRLNVYNIRGQLVKTLLDQPIDAGDHCATWNGTDNSGNPVASGVYFYRLQTGGLEQTTRMLLLK